MLTAPQLFAGVHESGTETCFFCGGSCEPVNTAKEFVKPSFTERDRVACGSSDWVCCGCVCAMDEKATVTLIDGETRENQKTRNYSWVLTDGKRLAATKSHREQLLALCLSPPTTPYAICLADGQKQQLWRTPVNHSRDVVSVNLEGTIVTYSPSQLIERLERVKRIIGATGKMAVSSGEPSRMLWPRMSGAMSANELQDLCTWWDRVRLEPLTRLAVWLAPGRSECGVDQ